MYDLFDGGNAGRILERLEKLNPGSKAAWGKMSVEHMLAHCATTLDTPFGADRKQHFMGKLFGKMAKKSSLSEKPFKKNSPTDPSFVVKGPRDFQHEKARLEAAIRRFATGGPAAITCKKHPFFGDFSANDWSFLMHKHLDHHFTQFGV
jgi:hypothetical protein